MIAGWRRMTDGLTSRRGIIAAVGVVAAIGAGVSVASVLAPAPPPASAGRVMQVRYVLVRQTYTPPPPSEAARLEVLPAGMAAPPHPEMLSVQALAAWNTLQQSDARRMAEALAQVRAADLRADREFNAELARLRGADPPQPQYAAPEEG